MEAYGVVRCRGSHIVQAISFAYSFTMELETVYFSEMLAELSRIIWFRMPEDSTLHCPSWILISFLFQPVSNGKDSVLVSLCFALSLLGRRTLGAASQHNTVSRWESLFILSYCQCHDSLILILWSILSVLHAICFKRACSCSDILIISIAKDLLLCIMTT
jgi:hypothetical protein